MPIFQLAAFADEASTSFSGQLAALKAHGLGALELRGVDGQSVADLSQSQAQEIARRLAGEGLTLSALGSPYGKYPIQEDFAPHREAFRRGLELARILGAQRIRMFSFFLPEDQPAALFRAKVFDQLEDMLNLAADAGIQLVHENEKGIYGDTAARCQDLMETFFPRMGQVFDPANLIQCRQRPEEAFPLLERYVTYLHVKDALHLDGSVVPAGQGDGRVEEILSRLAGRGGVFTLTLEPHLRIFGGLVGLQADPLKHRFAYPDDASAFAAAVSALKGLLVDLGYREMNKEQGLWSREEKR